MKFRHNDEVEIIKGVYEGCKGNVIDVSFFYRRYRVRVNDKKLFNRVEVVQ